jgi:hypothetical protein
MQKTKIGWYVFIAVTLSVIGVLLISPKPLKDDPGSQAMTKMGIAVLKESLARYRERENLQGSALIQRVIIHFTESNAHVTPRWEVVGESTLQDAWGNRYKLRSAGDEITIEGVPKN